MKCRLLIIFLYCIANPALATEDDCQQQIKAGVDYFQQGQYTLAKKELDCAYKTATGDPNVGEAQKAQAAGLLGMLHHQAEDYQNANDYLHQAIAYAAAPARDRARWTAALADTQAKLGREDAGFWYDQALALAGDDAGLITAIHLSKAGLLPANQRLTELQRIYHTLDGIGDAAERTRYALNLGWQAYQTYAAPENAGVPPAARGRAHPGRGVDGSAAFPEELKLAHDSFELARQSAGDRQPRLLAEALDGLAELYEHAPPGSATANPPTQEPAGGAAKPPLPSGEGWGEGIKNPPPASSRAPFGAGNALESLPGLQSLRDAALHLNRQALQLAESIDAGDLMIDLELRQSRLTQDRRQQLASLQRAVDHIEAIRQNIPVLYRNGISLFRENQGKHYRELVDLLLQTAAQRPPDQTELLRRARQTMELIKQTELEDFLGERCGVPSVPLETVESTTAIIYPIILTNRLELLVSIGDKIWQYTKYLNDKNRDSNIDELTLEMARNLHKGLTQTQFPAQDLYKLLIAPAKGWLDQYAVKTLVIVPDGVLRRIPFAALYDGKKYLIQDYALVTSPGLTLIKSDETKVSRHDARALLAGISRYGFTEEET